jgi:2'-5' RNA ligase
MKGMCKKNTEGKEMVESIRSFIAFDIRSNHVLDRLAKVQRLLAQTGADLKLVEPQNIHVTVRFLGNITIAKAEKIFEEMKEVDFTPFNVLIKGLGAFPNPRYSRVVWAGLVSGVEELGSVFSQLEKRLISLGFASDSRGFNPHLTIARVRSGRSKVRLADFIVENANYEFGSIKADCLLLKKSVLTPRGPIYSTLKEFCP